MGVKIRSRLFFGIKKLLPHATVRKEPVETDRLQAELITDGKLEYAVLGISAVEDLGQSPVCTHWTGGSFCFVSVLITILGAETEKKQF